MKRYCVLGTDARSNYLRKFYVSEGKQLVNYDDSPNYVITPVPFTRDQVLVNGESIRCDTLIQCAKEAFWITGALSKQMEEALQDISYVDVMKLDELAILNAIPTAEGAIFEAMKNTDTTLHGASCLVLGFGRIGKVLANMLAGMGANVSCEARKEKDLAMIQAMGYEAVPLNQLNETLPTYSYLFNTIPHMLLDQERLALLSKEALVIDLASNPGGVDFEKAKEMGIPVVWALSLPGKIAPKTAAIYLKGTIDHIIQEQEQE